MKLQANNSVIDVQHTGFVPALKMNLINPKSFPADDNLITITTKSVTHSTFGTYEIKLECTLDIIMPMPEINSIVKSKQLSRFHSSFGHPNPASF